MATFGFFSDSTLTVPITTITSSQNADGSSNPTQHHVYFGSLGSAGGDTSDRKVQANSNPGTDQVAVSITDSNVGSGHATTEVKLSLTQGGLASATAGAALNLGLTVTSGTINAKEIWLEVDDATLVAGTFTELGITTNSLRETAV